MTTNELYGDIADAIVDGEPIDWVAAESSDGEGDRGLVARLKLIATVAALHRRTHSDATGTVRPPASGDTSRRWGHLELLEPIGHGAFGEVYRAWDQGIDREVALKLLTARGPSDHTPSAAIIEEGRALARVRHPNVVTLYGAAEIDNRVGLWMELIQGQTLDQHVKRGRRWNAREAAALGVELCAAVSAVHAAGLLHRDIKASNVMMADDGRVVLMDFGTGRILADAPAVAPAGTPIYLAPEVFAGGDPSPASDIYSIGVVLFYVLSGSYPWRLPMSTTCVEPTNAAIESASRRARPDLPAALVSHSSIARSIAIPRGVTRPRTRSPPI